MLFLIGMYSFAIFNVTLKAWNDTKRIGSCKNHEIKATKPCEIQQSRFWPAGLTKFWYWQTVQHSHRRRDTATRIE